MGSLFARYAAALVEIEGVTDVSITSRVIEQSTRLDDGEPMADERESARGVGILLDDALGATYEDVTRVDVRWNVAATHYGSLTIPGYLDLEDAFVQPSEHDVGGEAADFLAELHLIECHDALHWTAFRTPGLADENVTVERMEIWTRIPSANGRSGLDLPLDADWNAYVDRMLLARGAEQFALTLVPDGAVAPDQRATFAHFLGRFCNAAALFRDPVLDDLVARTRVRCANLG